MVMKAKEHAWKRQRSSVCRDSEWSMNRGSVLVQIACKEYFTMDDYSTELDMEDWMKIYGLEKMKFNLSQVCQKRFSRTIRSI